jgi:ribonuclease HI
MYVIYVDGSSENPGIGVSVAIVKDENTGDILAQDVEIFKNSTCNEAEYRAIKLAINYIANTIPNEEVVIYSDSMLAVNQINGTYKIKDPILRELNETIKNIITDKQLKCVIKYIPREQNEKADSVAHAILCNILKTEKEPKKNKKKEVKKHGKRKPRLARTTGNRLQSKRNSH